MKQIVIISGKGGTGKTVLTASLAALAGNAVFADCDVDASNLHLLLKPEIKDTHEFRSGETAKIDKSICLECGKCANACKFEAIRDDFTVNGIYCEGCGVCYHLCPAKAITMEDNLSGHWYGSHTRYGPFVFAKLGIAEENSGKLVTLVRKQAKEIAEREGCDYVIIDGPPGIGCPVIASLSGVNLALIVTEPTLSGIHDMVRIADVAKHFSIEHKVVINKYDINLKNTGDIEEICRRKQIEVIGKLPFADAVNGSLIAGVPVVEFCRDRICQDIKNLWDKIK